jgi:hypothetical protein
MSVSDAMSVSDPKSPDYDPASPHYDVTADSSSKFYVGPLQGSTPSGDQIRAEVTAQVDLEIAHEDNWFLKFVRQALRDAQIQQRYSEKIDGAGRQLVDGVETRQVDAPPHTVWENASHEQMDATIRQNADSATVAQASETWISLGNELTEHQSTMAGTITHSLSNWQGEAGDAARTHLAKIGQWLGTTAQGATLAGRQQEIHSQTLNETQKRMAANPPVRFSAQEANARLQQINDPVEYAQQYAKDMAAYQAQKAAREQAARTMTQFDGTVGAAVTTPAFPSPPRLNADATSASTARLPFGARREAVSGGAAPGGGAAGGGAAGGGGTGSFGASAFGAGAAAAEGGAPGPGAGGPRGSAGFPGSGWSSSGSGAGADSGGGRGAVPQVPAAHFPGGAPSHGSVPHGSSPGVPTDGTRASGYPDPSAHLPGFTAPHVPTGSGSGAGTPHGGSPYGGVPSYGVPSGGGPFPATGSGSGPGAGFGRGPGGVPGSGTGAGTGRIGATLGGLGGSPGAGLPGGGSGAPGSSATGGGAGGGGAGGGAALGRGGTASGTASGAAAPAEGAPGRPASAPGARGTGSPGAMGMGSGAGAGRKEEDKEHKRAGYLVDPDSPGIFQPDGKVAPVTIGDWAAQKRAQERNQDKS